jgi:hypothetical protein
MSPAFLHKPLYYDAARRRLWICGQRCHHGATGALIAATGTFVGSASLLATGTALMAHDWRDRSIWFQRGWQNQP